MTDDWPFDDAKNMACFTTRQVVAGGTITFVSHDEDDGSWQFIGSEGAEMKDAMLVALSTVYRLHPEVGKLAMLPPGWEASRDSADAEWEWTEAPPEDESPEDSDGELYGCDDDGDASEAWKQA